MWRLIVGAFIGSLGAGLAKKESPGCLMNILSGIVGSYVGHFLLGEWGPHLAGNGSDSLYYRSCYRDQSGGVSGW